MIKFEGYERRIDKIMGVLKEYGIASLEDAQKICLDKGVDCDAIVKGIQPIAFDNAVWAYTVGCAIAIKKNCKKTTLRSWRVDKSASISQQSFPAISCQSSQSS